MKESMEALIHHFKVSDDSFRPTFFKLTSSYRSSSVRAILCLLARPTALSKPLKEKWLSTWSRALIPKFLNPVITTLLLAMGPTGHIGAAFVLPALLILPVQIS